MKSVIFLDGKKFTEAEFQKEEMFENLIKENSKMLFGSKTIYFDLKNKIDTKSLGSTIPDGFLFDFKDKDNPEFYIIEVELAKHDFYRHIFPQITKFFAFFKNSKNRSNLIDKLFNFIKSNPRLEEEFKSYLDKREIYKALKDTIENSQNILLIIDEDKAEFKEVFETYTDTWDKMVKLEVLKYYAKNDINIITLNPDFQDIDLVEVNYQDEHVDRYSESFHTEGVEEKIVNIYSKVKSHMLNFDQKIKTNPQKYYISLREKKNFAYIQLKKKKLHIVIMLPIEDGRENIENYKITNLSTGIQKFYNGSCFRVTLENDKNLDEIFKLLEKAYQDQK